MKGLVALGLLLTAPASAQQVQVNLSPNQPTVGDRVEAVITLQMEPGVLASDPRFPTWGATWGEAEVVEKTPPQKVSETIWRQRLVLAAFRPGQVPLPPAQIAVPLRDRTIQASTPAGLSLDVRSVLPRGEKNPQPKAEKPPVRLPIGETFWWTLAAMSLVCLILGLLLLWQQRTREETTAVEPRLAPFEELASVLDRLERELEREASAVRLHTSLSLAFRHYLGRRLELPAEERTTSEIHRLLLAGRLPAPMVRQAVELLRACDLIKFARQEVDREISQGRIDAARRIARGIEEREERLRPLDPAPLEATG
ncbi:MAG TPA: hypothetical protein VN493_28260 [Thermoanaerobaculia bacterium]|nr:hypothetical protein [Thermoanaerobaculia bacterium]